MLVSSAGRGGLATLGLRLAMAVLDESVKETRAMVV
jgi:hypothetical protein